MFNKIKKWLEDNKRLSENNKALIGKLVKVETERGSLLPGVVIEVGRFSTKVQLFVVSPIFGTLHPVVWRPHRNVTQCSGLGEAGCLMFFDLFSR